MKYGVTFYGPNTAGYGPNTALNTRCSKHLESAERWHDKLRLIGN